MVMIKSYDLGIDFDFLEDVMICIDQVARKNGADYESVSLHVTDTLKKGKPIYANKPDEEIEEVVNILFENNYF